MSNLKHTIVVINHKIAKVRNVDDKQLEQLKNEELKQIEKEKEDFLHESQFKHELQTEILKLKVRNFHLAKSIYDNFVDRGLCEDNVDFQKAYYDYVFNGKDIKLEDTPTDFQTIYRKVVD